MHAHSSGDSVDETAALRMQKASLKTEAAGTKQLPSPGVFSARECKTIFSERSTTPYRGRILLSIVADLQEGKTKFFTFF
jgi:hypothetical protein